MSESKAVAVATKRRRWAGQSPDPQASRTPAWPVELPSDLSTLVFAFLPFLDSPGEAKDDEEIPSVDQVRNNTKLVCKQMSEWVKVKMLDHRMTLQIDESWTPLIAKSGLDGITQALASQIRTTDAKGKSNLDGISVRSCEAFMWDGRAVHRLMGRFGDIQFFTFILNGADSMTATPSNFDVSLATLFSLRNLSRLHLEVPRDWSVTNLWKRVSGSVAPLTEIIVKGLIAGQLRVPPSVEFLKKWPRLPHLKHLQLDVDFVDVSSLSTALAYCEVLEVFAVRFVYNHRGNGTDINNAFMQLSIALSERKNPLKRVTLEVDGGGFDHSYTAGRAYVFHDEMLRSWLRFADMRDFRVGLPESWSHMRTETEDGKLQHLLLEMLTVWRRLDCLNVCCHVHNTFLQQTQEVATSCRIYGVKIVDQADLIAISLWQARHPRCELLRHVASRYTLSDAKQTDWKALTLAVNMTSSDIMRFMMEGKVAASTLAPLFAAAPAPERVSIQALWTPESKNQLVIDDGWIGDWDNLADVTCLQGTLAFSDKLFPTTLRPRRQLLVFFKANELTQRFVSTGTTIEVLLDDRLERRHRSKVEVKSVSAQQLVADLYDIDKDSELFPPAMFGIPTNDAGLWGGAWSWRLQGSNVTVRYIEAFNAAPFKTESRVWIGDDTDEDSEEEE